LSYINLRAKIIIILDIRTKTTQKIVLERISNGKMQCMGLAEAWYIEVARLASIVWTMDG
jgi:hypothetical protein